MRSSPVCVAAHLEADDDLAAGDAKRQLREMARDHIAGGRCAQAVLDKGVKPWSGIRARSSACSGTLTATVSGSRGRFPRNRQADAQAGPR
ncbi:hypothetical protein ACTWPT_16760 [Nonomuraea sp. 3N208]|uniref:hypothetical protein n=1 Tax=Nonomuraea sp. 3N208 TaxID=3457421 RepID=UPI003FCEDCCC